MSPREGLCLVLGWRGAQRSAPALQPARCGAEPRAWLSMCLSSHRCYPCYKLKQMAPEQHLSLQETVPEEGNSWMYFIGKALNRNPLLCYWGWCL